MAAEEEKLGVDWRTRFKKGDVVRSRDGEAFGVVLHVGRYWDTPPKYELQVDMPEGVGIWEPWAAVLSNDPVSVAEAKRLGLRGLDREEEARYEDERRHLLESPRAARARAEVLPRVLAELSEFESRKDGS